jgi:hypothetical protein
VPGVVTVPAVAADLLLGLAVDVGFPFCTSNTASSYSFSK